MLALGGAFATQVPATQRAVAEHSEDDWQLRGAGAADEHAEAPRRAATATKSDWVRGELGILRPPTGSAVNGWYWLENALVKRFLAVRAAFHG